MNKIIFFIPLIISLLQVESFPIVPNQSDNFQDGTAQNWTMGASNPNPLLVIRNGGLTGVGDQFLRVFSTGTGTADSKLVFFNTHQWSGDYINAGVVNISLWINNTGLNSLKMRLAFTNGVSWIASANPIIINPGTGWHAISFSLLQADMTVLAGGNYNSIMSHVTALRMLHSLMPNYIGDQIAAQLDLDVITAAASPTGVNPATNPGLVSYSLSQNYPNPCNPSTTIKYFLPFLSNVSLYLYNVLGDKIKELLTEIQPAGTYEKIFDISGLASGIYLYSLEAVSVDNRYSYKSTRKMIYIK